jgi:hypothetical protein
MRITAITQTRWILLFRSAVSAAALLSIFGSIGGILFLSADDSAWKAILLVAVPGLAAFVTITSYASLARARADRRWRVALDHYAQKELDRYTKHGRAKPTEPRR